MARQRAFFPRAWVDPVEVEAITASATASGTPMTNESPPPRSELPPHLVELIDEIDSASHDAAKTMAALVGELDVPSRVRKATRQRMQAVLGGPSSAPQRTAGATAVAPMNKVWPILMVAVALSVLGRLLRLRPHGPRAGVG
jgi:hypothetical protein